MLPSLRVFRQQKILGKALLRKIREVIPVFEADANGIEPGPPFQCGKNALDGILHISRLVQHLQDFPAHFVISFHPLALGDIARITMHGITDFDGEEGPRNYTFAALCLDAKL